ncbi:aconitate hydratase AcnA [Kitasatospora sp. NBC_01250]|uniref:aconitate hydratase AcnA n=1 Tax=unclassified Kitasatospora TaxID=2633591 RepID=UPI002E116858|nr:MULTISPECIES: aconitate hydratase AcnA [unclassified Kitasatospora]WSJ71258.1 aconitate hydratase AcnA [Kitasatospora sp. NBC_01302]
MTADTLIDQRPAPATDLPAFAERAGLDLAAVPYCGRVLAESLLREGAEEQAGQLLERLAEGRDPALEMAFRPARILVQDYTGIPLLVDLAALRDQVREPRRVNLGLPVDVVVDHSVQADWTGRPDAQARNEAREMTRNRERYGFLRWAEEAFDGLRVIPPGQGIVHQVNLEQLATVVATDQDGRLVPDTVIGTDSHTTMVNGMGVLGWGVGGLEAEALMLGLAHPIRIPAVVGVRLTGAVPAGTTAADLALTLTRLLRQENVRGLMLEFTGPGIEGLSVADRCTIANMAPEYGAMTAFFPVDAQTLAYLRETGRPAAHVRQVEEYCGRQQLLRSATEPAFGRIVEFDLGSVRPSLAGPSRPDQHLTLAELPGSLASVLTGESRQTGPHRDGDLAIAAITSCTHTSNPQAMLAAGLLARRAVARGLRVPPHVKTSLSPGSQAVTRYLEKAGLLADLEQLGFHVAGYGCMTCNGGSGGLHPEMAEAVERDGVTACAVLSGNRNFEARVHAQVRAAYLGSPALVVALALVGHVRIDLSSEPLGTDADGAPVRLADLWPSTEELLALEKEFVTTEVYGAGQAPDAGWADLTVPGGEVFAWDEESTYIRPPAYVGPATALPTELRGARVLVALGDNVSTDHISPVGSIPEHSPAGRYLHERATAELNSYGSRRGNHEVMARATFSNPRLRNHLVEGAGGGTTTHLPTGERLPVFEAAERYALAGTPLIVLAGKNYGTGSSRDWAAKGPRLLGVRAVLAESYERIHRGNLCAMGILPLLLPEGQTWADLGLTGAEEFELDLGEVAATGRVRVAAGEVVLTARADVRSAGEWEVLGSGGTLPYLLERLRAEEAR